MRTISKKTKYGLRALFAMTRRHGAGPAPIAALSAEERIPLKFLEAILLDLRKAGLVESKRGPGGGYRLSRSPAAISVGAVIRVLEGPLAPLPCASETAFKPCPECPDVRSCGIRMVMRQVRDAMAAILDGTTLEAVVNRVDAAKDQKAREDTLMYYI